MKQTTPEYDETFGRLPPEFRPAPDRKREYPCFWRKPIKLTDDHDLPATDSGYWLTERTWIMKPISLIEKRQMSKMGNYLSIPPPHGWLCFWNNESHGTLLPSLNGGSRSFFPRIFFTRIWLSFLPHDFYWWTPLFQRDVVEKKAAEFHFLLHGEKWTTYMDIRNKLYRRAREVRV